MQYKCTSTIQLYSAYVCLRAGPTKQLSSRFLAFHWLVMQRNKNSLTHSHYADRIFYIISWLHHYPCFGVTSHNAVKSRIRWGDNWWAATLTSTQSFSLTFSKVKTSEDAPQGERTATHACTLSFSLSLSRAHSLALSKVQTAKEANHNGERAATGGAATLQNTVETPSVHSLYRPQATLL